jgi:hypothetical protein
MFGAVTIIVIVVIYALVAGPVRGSHSPAVGAVASASNAAGEMARGPSKPAPAQVVQDYYEAINRRDWPLVWRLGGRNVGTGSSATYAGMVAGYQSTIRDTLTEVRAVGNAVTGRFLAHQAGGIVRTYQFNFVVRNGVIVSGTAEPA